MIDQGSELTQWRSELDTASLELLRLLAIVGLTPLPEAILADHRSALPSELASVFAAEQPREALQSVRWLALAQWSATGLSVPDEQTRERIREFLGSEDLARSSEWVVAFLDAALPASSDDPRQWGKVDALIDHVLSAVTTARGLSAKDETSVSLAAQLASLLERVGRYFDSRGRYKIARDVLTETLSICREQPGIPAGLRGKVCRSLARPARGLGESAVAITLLEEALAIHEAAEDGPESVHDHIDLAAALGEGSQDTATALRHVDCVLEMLGEKESVTLERGRAYLVRGSILVRDGKRQEGRRELERAVEFLERVDQRRAGLDAIEARAALGYALADGGARGNGRGMLEDALNRTEEILGSVHPEVGLLLSKLGSVCRDARDFGPARAHLERSLDIAEQLLPEHPALYVRHAKLAEVFERQHSYRAARDHWTAGLGLVERLYGDSLPLVEALQGLAGAQQRLGNHKAAELAYTRALYVAETLDPDNAPRLADLRRLLAETEISLGNVGGALEALIKGPRDGDEEAPIFRLATGHLIERLGHELAEACRASGQPTAAAGIARQIHGVSRALARGALESEDPGAVMLAASLATQAGALDDAARGFEHAVLVAPPGDQSLSRALALGWESLARAYRRRGKDDVAISKLERAVAAVSDDPNTQGALLVVLAGLHAKTRHLELAIELAGEACERLKQAHDASGLIRALAQLARLQWTAAHNHEAVDTFRQRLDLVRVNDPDDSRQLTTALQDLGHALRGTHQLDDALEVDEQAVRAAREVDEGRLVAMALLGLARTHEARGDLQAALETYEERLRLVRAFASPDHLAEGVTLHDLGDVRLARGELDEAIGLYERALAHKQHAGHRRDRAASMLALARANVQRGNDEDAVRILRERMAVLESAVPRDQVAEADTLTYMAAIENERSNHEEALKILERVLELVPNLDDELRPAHTFIQAAVAALGAGRDAEAATLAGQAVAGFEGASRPDGDGLAFALAMLARARRREPASMLEALLSSVRAYQSTTHSSLAAAAPVARTLGDTCAGLGLVELAAAVEELAGAVLEEHGPLPDSNAQESSLERVRANLACGRLDEARDALEEAVVGDWTPALSGEWLQLGRCLQARGSHQDAAQAFERALTTIAGSPERIDMQEALIRGALADSVRALGREGEAIELYEAAVSALETRHAREAPGVLLSLGRALYASSRLREAEVALRRRLTLLRATRPDPSAEGVTLHDLGNVYRLRGHTKSALSYYRDALAAKLEGHSAPRDVAVTTLSLAYILRRVKPVPGPQLDDLAQESERLLADAMQTAELQSPKALASAFARTGGSARGAAVGSDVAAALSALSATAIAGLVRLSHGDARVPLAVGAEAEPGSEATQELILAGLVSGEPTGRRLTARAEHAMRLLWSGDLYPTQGPRRAEELLLGAQLCAIDGDAKAALDLLRKIDGEEQSIDAAIARALEQRLTGGAGPVADLRSELAERLHPELDGASVLGIAAGALDCDDPDLACRALSLLDAKPGADNAQKPDLTADAGVAWHSVAVAFEAEGELDGARDAYRRARAAFATLHVDLEIAPMRHQADMLRFARQSDEALALEHSTPFSPSPAGTRVLMAATCLRAARLQTLIGRPLAGKACNWWALSCARFVPSYGTPARRVASITSRTPRETDRARVQALSPSAIGLLELLRQDAHDSALRHILPGLLVDRGSWRTAVVAAHELERAGLAELWLRSGWLRLSKRGGKVAAALSS